jgi:hypothetical protein
LEQDQTGENCALNGFETNQRTNPPNAESKRTALGGLWFVSGDAMKNKTAAHGRIGD